jgi:signal peptidase I
MAVEPPRTYAILDVGKVIKLAIIFVILWVIVWGYHSISCFRLEGDEMSPTIPRESFKIVTFPSKTPKNFSKNDIVFFDYASSVEGGRTRFIGRIVATEGDSVKIVNGTLYVNGSKVPEGYVDASVKSKDSMVEIIVPKGTVFILCDNRKGAKKIDSRYIGPVSLWAISGKVK